MLITQNRKNFINNLKLYTKAGVSFFHVETVELKELKEDIDRFARAVNRSFFYYSFNSLKCNLYYGCKDTIRNNFNKQQRNQECSLDEFIDRLVTEPENDDIAKTSIPTNCVILAAGISSSLDTAEFTQKLIEAVSCEFFRIHKISLILTDTILELPDKLLTYSTPIQYPLPDKTDLELVFNAVKYEYSHTFPKTKRIKEYWFEKQNIINSLIHASLGMTAFEAATAFRLCFSYSISLDTRLEDLLALIANQRKQAIQSSSILHLIPEEELPDVRYIGGMDHILQFLAIRAKAFTPEAEEAKIDIPKGIILTGITGTGKSTVAKAAGRILKLPVITFDIGSIFNSYIGVSESRVRQELARIDALNGSVLIIDEADKALAGTNSDSSTDGGVAMRVFGAILTWLQEKKSKTFVIMTMNNTDLLPSEIFRAGRFDKVFNIGLPSANDRRNILYSHMRKRGIVPELNETDWRTLLSLTENYVGAELEALIVDARYLAFNRRNTGIPLSKELYEVLKDRKPMYSNNIGYNNYH